jgi:hypothetical protein
LKKHLKSLNPVRKYLIGFKPDQVVVVEKKEGTAAVLLNEEGVELILSSVLATK